MIWKFKFGKGKKKMGLEERVTKLEKETSEEQQERLRLNDRTPEEVEQDKKDAEAAAAKGQSLEDYRASGGAAQDAKKNSKNKQAPDHPNE